MVSGILSVRNFMIGGPTLRQQMDYARRNTGTLPSAGQWQVTPHIIPPTGTEVFGAQHGRPERGPF